MKSIEVNKLTKFDFPVSRIGNITNPKLIILLENQASHPDRLTLNPEYVLFLENKFNPKLNSSEKNNEHMTFEDVVQYDKWWYDLSKIWLRSNIKLQNSEVLALEFYPYATSADIDPIKCKKEKEAEIYINKWEGGNRLAKELLYKNLKILNAALKNEVPIFVYYKSGWYTENKNVEMNPRLDRANDNYISHYEPKNAVPSGIKDRLKKFLEKPIIQKQILELRNDLDYQLKFD